MRGGKTYKRGVVCMRCFSAKDVNFARLILRGKRRILRVESSSSSQWCSRNKNITGTLGRKPAAGGKNFWTCTLLQVSFSAFLVN